MKFKAADWKEAVPHTMHNTSEDLLPNDAMQAENLHLFKKAWSSTREIQ